ncbi:hypothetical protein JCM3765_007800 [Sporobolomyces pararoseus]
MASRSMMRSVSAPAADLAPPPSVQIALQSTPFKSSTTRRDLSTSFRGFKAAWSAIEQIQVLSASCRRLGERAGEVLMAVREKLEQIEKDESSQKGGKVVLERSYEFQGSQTGGELAGKTIFKIQSQVFRVLSLHSFRRADPFLPVPPSAMLDLQALATDHLAKSNASRLTLLVDDLAKTKSAFSKLSNSLLACISIYSISPSTITTSLWPEQDASDLAKDHVALPRLFQLSIMLKGPVYERFTKERTDGPTSTETPGQRRAAFVEWCLDQNPILRPNHSGEGSKISQQPAVTKQSLRPSNGLGLGLGLPSSLSAGTGGVSMRRAVTQPLAFSTPTPSTSPPVPLSDDVKTSTRVESQSSASVATTLASESISSLSPSDPSSDPVPSDNLADSYTSILNPSQSTDSIAADEPTPSNPANSPDQSVGIVAVSSVQPSVKPDVPDDSPTSHELDRSTSTVSSMAMTNSSSTGSLLFEPVLPSIEVVEVQKDDSPAEAEVEETREAIEGMKVEPNPETQGETTREDEVEEESVGTDEVEMEEEGETPIGAVGLLGHLVGVSTPESNSSTPIDDNNSVLGLALDIPLSPQVDDLFSPSDRNTVSAARSSPTPAPLQLLEPLPIEDNSSPHLEPSGLPPSPALPSSPSLVITSFDDGPDTLDAPPSPPPEPDRPFRVLSLDGGGLVGPIPQLLALKKELLDNTSDSTKPSQYFDLIVGTSSSALPALLLGQLGLSIDESLQICSQISRRALGLEGPTTTSSSSSKQQSKPRRIGRWSRFFSRSSKSSKTLDRRTALDIALKQFIPSATAPLPPSRTPCRAAVLAFQRTATENRAQECWLSESSLSLSEIVQASMSFPSTFSSFVPSPTSFNPTSSALKYSQSLLASTSTSADRSIELTSVSIGYSPSTIPLHDSITTKKSNKGFSRTRIERLKELRSIGAGNSAAHESLSKKLERQVSDQRIYLKRIDTGLDSRELCWKDEGELVDSLRLQIFGNSQQQPPLSPKQYSNSNFSLKLSSPPSSPSSFVSQPPPLSPYSPGSTKSLSVSPRKRLNFFNEANTTNRSISSSALAPTTISSSSSPYMLDSRHRNLSLAFEGTEQEDEEEVIVGFKDRNSEKKRQPILRSSISMGELLPRRELQGPHGYYSYSGAGGEGSLADVRM